MKAALIALAAATLFSTAVAHADPNEPSYKKGDRYIAELKANGLVEGESYGFNDENQAIVTAQTTCDIMTEQTQKGLSAAQARQHAIRAGMFMPDSPTPEELKSETVETDAAIDVYCPQYKS